MFFEPSDRPLERGALGPPRVPPRTAVGLLTPPPPGRGVPSRALRPRIAWRWYAFAAAPIAVGTPLAVVVDATAVQALGAALAATGLVALASVAYVLHMGQWLGRWRARRALRGRAVTARLHG